MEEPTTSDAAARVQLIEAPIMSPGCCALCGKSEHPVGFADPGLAYEFHGNFYLCGDCIGDFARIFGWVEPKRFVEFLREHEEVLIHNSLLHEQVESLGAIKNAIDYYSGINPTISDDSSSDVHVADIEAEQQDSPGQSESNSFLTGEVIFTPGPEPKSEPDITESVSIERPDDVPSIRSDADELLAGLDL